MIMYFGRSKCEASAGQGVVLHQPGYSKGFQQHCCFQNRSGRQSCFNSAWKGLAGIVFGNRLHYILKHIHSIYFSNVFHALMIYDRVFWTF